MKMILKRKPDYRDIQVWPRRSVRIYKRILIVLFLMCICGFGTPMVYAGAGTAAYGVHVAVKNGWFTKQCPVCEGRKGTSTWYGGWTPCDNCGGSGKVTRWWAVALVAVLVLGAAFEKSQK